MDAGRPAPRVAAVAGAALAGREREDARLRGAPRDAGDAAHRAQPSRAAGDRRLPRGPVAGAARHRGRPVPRARRSQPARVHRMRRRGSQLRVLPPPRAVRPAVETLGRGAADRPARSHRPPHPGRDRVLPSARRDRLGRRPALRDARSLPRAAGRPRAATGPGGVEGALVPSAFGVGSAKRRTSSSIATRTARTWPRRSSRACPRSSTRSTRRSWSRPASAWGSPSSARAAAGCSRSSWATRRWSTACRASPAGRATSARSTAKRRWRTRPSTSSPPAIRSWRGLAYFEDSALGRVARFEVEIGAESGEGLVAIYKDGPVFEVVVIDSAGRRRPDWAAAIRRRPLRASTVTDNADQGVTGRAWSVVWVNGSTHAPSARARGHRGATGALAMNPGRRRC